jgi:hypothetical protein
MRIATPFRRGKRNGDSHTGEAFTVEVLAAYSHSAQAADLRLCHTVALTSPVCAPKPSAKRPESPRDHLDERDIADLITAYRDGATAASHGLNLTSVDRRVSVEDRLTEQRAARRRDCGNGVRAQSVSGW